MCVFKRIQAYIDALGTEKPEIFSSFLISRVGNTDLFKLKIYLREDDPLETCEIQMHANISGLTVCVRCS